MSPTEAAIDQRLANMDAAFDDAPMAGASVPDGDYEARIDRFDFVEVNGSMKLTTEVLITAGDYEGLAPPKVWHDLEDQSKLQYLKGFLSTLGVEGLKLSELRSKLNDLLDTPVAIRVKTTTKGGNTYTNTYINERLGDPGPRLPADQEGLGQNGQQAEEDIPF